MATTDGFVRLPNWLLDDHPMNLYELTVYTVLLRFRSPKTGTCFPGMTTIADLGRMSVKSAERAVRGLEEVHGVITVDRRASITDNKPNVYTVALPAKTRPATIGRNSARGSRIPRRLRGTDSESSGQRLPGTELPRFEPIMTPTPTDSESVGTDSESSPPQTPSLTKKTNEKKTKKEDVTPTFAESGCESFSFDLPDESGATERQVAYLKDLAIHLGYGAGDGIPNDLVIQRWRKLTRDQADTQIRGYLKALGRPDDIEYPQEGDPEYAALSDAGKEFAESSGDPSSVWDYTSWHEKENTA